MGKKQKLPKKKVVKSDLPKDLDYEKISIYKVDKVDANCCRKKTIF